jgi:hypothetical protein
MEVGSQKTVEWREKWKAEKSQYHEVKLAEKWVFLFFSPLCLSAFPLRGEKTPIKTTLQL